MASTSTIGRPLPLYAGVHQGRGAAHYLMLDSIEATSKWTQSAEDQKTLLRRRR